jgi:LuxR family maltose regulon positive regulatory protein
MLEDSREATVTFTTKFVVPRSPTAMVLRPRLAHLLQRSANDTLTLIVAPPGSGKTALLASWIKEGRPPGAVAWLPLDREDNERRRFWTGVVAALRRADPTLASLAVPPRGLSGFLPAFVNALAKRRAPLILVLDDLHEVSEPAVIADLDVLLDRAPGSFRVVASTRSDPPLRLGRLRLAGRLTEVRADELAFTLDEAGALMRALGVALAREDLERLWRRTEGWAAGLRLAAVSLQGQPDPHDFVTGFAGDDRAVSDYLLTEVVAREPPESLGFLLRTSIVERVNGELADALTGSPGGDRQLDELMRRNGLVAALDAHGSWYRYHPLLADVLRIELARRMPDEVSELHRRAARWNDERGHALDALRHSVAAGDWGLASEIVGEHWLSLVMRGQGAPLRGLLKLIPVEVVRSDAELSLATAGLLLEAGDAGGADEFMGIAHELARRLPEARRRRFAVTSTATDLYRARMRGDVEKALSAARLVLAEHWDRAVAEDVRALTLANLGIAELWRGDTAAAGSHLEQAAGLASDCGNDYVHFLAEGYVAAVDVLEGRLVDGWHRGRAAVELAEQRGWTLVPQFAIAYLAVAAVHVFWNELEAAEEAVERSSRALRRSSERLLAAANAQLRAYLLAYRGKPLRALEALRGPTTAAWGAMPRFLRVSTSILEGELRLALGEPERAREVWAKLDAEEDAPDAALGVARLELAAGEPRAAVDALSAFFHDERAPVMPNASAEARVIDAIAHDSLNEPDSAKDSLERALDLAEPPGFRNAFLRYRAPVRSLLRRHVRSGTRHRAFAGELLDALQDGAPADRPSGGPLLEPLSERELAVLRYLPTMMSNGEIASEMFVSPNTVKTHLKHVYRKLDVTDRRGAVRRARELRLLGPAPSRR